MEAYFQNVRTPQDEAEAEDLVWNNVISPLNIVVPDAFHLLKPRDIPGFFTISFDERTGQWWLYYVEPML